MNPPRRPPSDPAAAARAAAALARLKQLHPRSIDLGLERVVALLDALGAPHRSLPPVVHLAGTNGKGSTLAFLQAMLQASGCRVHAYTSPHLVRFNERIRLAGAPIGDAALAAALERVEAANAGGAVTFFEATTAAAFLAMAETPADIVLLETGLGGRLDATNVIDRPAATVITPVAMDHMDWLGGTLAAIAGEKAGILKPGVPAVIAPQPDEAAAAIAARAEAVGATLHRAGEAWSARGEGDGMVYEDRRRRLVLPPPALPGAHQIVNAGAAIAVTGLLDGFAVPEYAIASGLRAAAWPGRLQRLDAGALADRLPPGAALWVDAAHNLAGAAALAGWVSATADPPTVLVVGMYEDKPADAFLGAFAGRVARVVAVPFTGERPCHDPAAVAAAAAGHGIPAATAAGLGPALDGLADAGPCRVVICGSVALAGQALAENGTDPG